MTATSTFNPTSEQLAIGEAVSEQKLPVVVQARAGTGKTSTIVSVILPRLRGETLILAYNKSIQQELQKRLPPGASFTTTVATVHAFGLNAMRAAGASKFRIDGGKLNFLFRNLCRGKASIRRMFRDEKLTGFPLITRLASHAKNAGFGVVSAHGKNFPAIEDQTGWHQLISHFNMESEIEAADLTPANVIDMARQLLLESNRTRNLIDFDDMIYLPLLDNTPIRQFDHVAIDEAQDISSTRLELSLRAAATKGRIIAVGDDRQAIYGFCHPAGTPVLMADNTHRAIETLQPGEMVLASNTSGEVMARPVLANNQFKNEFTHHLRVSVGSRSVIVTPHHKFPVRFGSETTYFTYLMVRNGVWRVGSSKAYNKHGFLLNIRMRQEKCQHAWILTEHFTMAEAREQEKFFHQFVQGRTFSKLTDRQVAELPDHYDGALNLLAMNNRLLDFPFLSRLHANTRRVSRNGVFVLEACNILPSMRGCFYSDTQAEGRKHGRRQSYDWQHIRTAQVAPTDTTWGITIQPASYHPSAVPHPLYFAGDDILVHNTGAMSDSLDQIISLTGAKTYPLTVCWRCDEAIIARAQSIVPDIRARPGAPAGTVSSQAIDDLLASPSTIPLGSAFLCRLNRPNVAVALQLLSAGLPAQIEGRDIGRNLVTHVKKAEPLYASASLPELLAALSAYSDTEQGVLLRNNKRAAAALLADEIEASKLLLERGMVEEPANKPFAALEALVARLFADNIPPARKIILSSVHKSKGREWPRVYILGQSDFMPFFKAETDWELEQEDNLIYVATTRAEHDLISVTGVASWLSDRAKEGEGE